MKIIECSLFKTLDIVKKDKFLINTLIFMCGSLMIGALNYLYHLLMARMLTVVAYGELQSLLAIFTVTSIPTAALVTVLAKYTADFKVKNQWNKIYSLLLFFTKKTLVVGLISFLTFVIFSGPIARFLNLSSSWPVVILGMAFLFGFPHSINSGVLRGLQKFKELTIVSFVSTVFKLFISILLVKFGFAINGAIGSVTLALLIGYYISFFPLNFLYKQHEVKVQVKEIVRYSIPVFFTLLFTSLLYSVAVILVKHFFPAETAGAFGALVLLGSIICFMTGPIAGVMFPMVADAHSSSQYPAKILKKAIYLTLAIGIVIVISYFLVPDLIIKILIGSKFLLIGKYLGWFGLSIFSYSLVVLLVNYFLSIGKGRVSYLVGIGALAQIVLISIFHSTLWQIIWIMNGSMLFVLLLLSIYFFKIYYICQKE